jgi:hypothetical protein
VSFTVPTISAVPWAKPGELCREANSKKKIARACPPFFRPTRKLLLSIIIPAFLEIDAAQVLLRASLSSSFDFPVSAKATPVYRLENVMFL